MTSRPPTALVSVALAVLVVAPYSATALSLFRSVIVIDADTRAVDVVGTDDLTDIPKLLSQARLENLFPDIDFDTEMLGIDATIDLRGVPINAGFAANDTNLVVDIPILGVSVEFAADERDEAIAQFQAWLKGQLDVPGAENEVLSDLLGALVDLSAVDPVAGNPNSMQSKMMESAYRLATTGPHRPRPRSKQAAEWNGKDLFRSEFEYEHFVGGPYIGDSYDLSLDYMFNFKNPKWAVLIDIPVAVTKTQGAKSFFVSSGLGLQYRPKPWWNLTPAIRFGGTGSLELGAVAILTGLTMTSSMRFPIQQYVLSLGSTRLTTPKFELNLGNMFGWSRTFDDIEISGLRLAYRLNNYTLRNGLDLTKEFGRSFFGGRPTARLYFIDTWIGGSDLFLDHYDELGLSLGMRRNKPGYRVDSLELALGWVVGRSYNSVLLRASLRF